MDTQINTLLVLYAVSNSKGQFFRAKGYNGSGATWVDDINQAQIEGKIGSARATITWFANYQPKYQTPDLLKLTVTGIEVLDETQRVKKAQEKKAKEEAYRKEAQAKQAIEYAEKNLKEAQERLNQLKKR